MGQVKLGRGALGLLHTCAWWGNATSLCVGLRRFEKMFHFKMTLVISEKLSNTLMYEYKFHAKGVSLLASTEHSAKSLVAIEENLT